MATADSRGVEFAIGIACPLCEEGRQRKLEQEAEEIAAMDNLLRRYEFRPPRTATRIVMDYPTKGK